MNLGQVEKSDTKKLENLDTKSKNVLMKIFNTNYAPYSNNPITPASTKASEGYTPGFANLVNFGRSRRSQNGNESLQLSSSKSIMMLRKEVSPHNREGILKELVRNESNSHRKHKAL